MQFDQMSLIEPLLRAIRREGYEIPTPIQVKAIPHVLAGTDLLGCAQTGTGKTAAFALPILQRLHEANGHATGGAKGGSGARRIRALVVTPTRELAAQIGESFGTYGRYTDLRHTIVYGGVKQFHQVKALDKGVDILVATPGRLLDLLGQRVLTLHDVEVLVLDEADRMLDMGFIHDIRRIITQLPAKRQTLLFSATMPREIRTLADTILHKPVSVTAAAINVAADTVEQVVYFVDRNAKMDLLEHLLGNRKITRALVFSRTKWGADKISRLLRRAGIIATAIHSNKSQNARERALNEFKAGDIRVLVASDIAARGLDVDDISHVINFDLPHEPEIYVHRVGRTGRAGAIGQAISFCSEEQHALLDGIQRLLGRTIPVKHSSKFTSPPQGDATPTDEHAAAPATTSRPQRKPTRGHTPTGTRRENATEATTRSRPRRKPTQGRTPTGERRETTTDAAPADRKPRRRRRKPRPMGSGAAAKPKRRGRR